MILDEILDKKYVYNNTTNFNNFERPKNNF